MKLGGQRWGAAVIGWILLGALAPFARAAAVDVRAVCFPNLALATNETIQRLEVTVDHGEILAVYGLPGDWSLDMGRRSVFDEPDLIAEAGHFPAGLRDIHELDHLVTVLAGHPSGFAVRAALRLVESGEDANPERTLVMTNLILQAVAPEEWPAFKARPMALDPSYAQPCPPPPPPDRQVKAEGLIVFGATDSAALICRDFSIPLEELQKLNPQADFDHPRIGMMVRVRPAQH